MSQEKQQEKSKSTYHENDGTNVATEAIDDVIIAADLDLARVGKRSKYVIQLVHLDVMEQPYDVIMRLSMIEQRKFETKIYPYELQRRVSSWA